MKKLYSVIAVMLIAAFALSACAPAAPAVSTPTSEEMPADTEAVEQAPVAKEATTAPDAAPVEEAATEPEDGFAWDQDYITASPAHYDDRSVFPDLRAVTGGGSLYL